MTKKTIFEMADTQAEIILSQGLPRHIVKHTNQTSTAKAIWENVEMLMQSENSEEEGQTTVCRQIWKGNHKAESVNRGHSIQSKQTYKS
ncbi:hypothetical protein Tco_0343231 [Tanacetum coccineum]